MADGTSLRQDSLRQDSLNHRLAYRAPGFERSCAHSSQAGKRAQALGKCGQYDFIGNYFIFGNLGHSDILYCHQLRIIEISKNNVVKVKLNIAHLHYVYKRVYTNKNYYIFS